MAEEAEKEKDKEKDPAKKKEEGTKAGGLNILKNKLILFAIIGVVVLGIGAGGFLVFASKSGPDQEEAVAESSSSAPAHGEQKEGVKGELEKGGGNTIFALDPFIVNLQDNSGTRYLKLTVNLELSGGAGTTDELQAQTAKIRDAVIVLLSSKSYIDIGTVEGKYQMRDEIVERVNQFLVKGRVRTAYFTDFVIQ
jgi:flagellar FliL protein